MLRYKYTHNILYLIFHHSLSSGRLFDEHKSIRINGKHTGWAQQEFTIHTDRFDRQYPLWSHGSSNSQELAGAQKLVPLFVWKWKQILSSDTQLTKENWLHGWTEHFDDERIVGTADTAIILEENGISNSWKEYSLTTEYPC